MTFDPKAQQLLMWNHMKYLIARAGPEYAIKAAESYESRGAGLFDGLKDKVIEAIDKANAKKQAEVA